MMSHSHASVATTFLDVEYKSTPNQRVMPSKMTDFHGAYA